MKFYEAHLLKAIELAELGRASGEYPFGSVLAEGATFLHGATDGTISTRDPTQHAETRVISEYCRRSDRIRLNGLTIYCSVEPCVMCSGAIHWAHLEKVVFSVSQKALQQITGGIPKPPCANFINIGRRQVEVFGPILESEGHRVLRDFDFTLKARLAVR